MKKTLFVALFLLAASSFTVSEGQSYGELVVQTNHGDTFWKMYWANESCQEIEFSKSRALFAQNKGMANTEEAFCLLQPGLWPMPILATAVLKAEVTAQPAQLALVPEEVISAPNAEMIALTVQLTELEVENARLVEENAALEKAQSETPVSTVVMDRSLMERAAKAEARVRELEIALPATKGSSDEDKDRIGELEAQLALAVTDNKTVELTARIKELEEEAIGLQTSLDEARAEKSGIPGWFMITFVLSVIGMLLGFTLWLLTRKSAADEIGSAAKSVVNLHKQVEEKRASLAGKKDEICNLKKEVKDLTEIKDRLLADLRKQNLHVIAADENLAATNKELAGLKQTIESRLRVYVLGDELKTVEGGNSIIVPRAPVSENDKGEEYVLVNAQGGQVWKRMNVVGLGRHLKTNITLRESLGVVWTPSEPVDEKIKKFMSESESKGNNGPTHKHVLTTVAS